MDIRDLAALVPALMTSNPQHRWVLLSGTGTSEDLVIEVSPMLAPDRTARVHVMRSAEVHFMDFAGHSSSDFAYEDDERIEALRGRLDLAVQATLGPTRVTLDRAGEVIVRSVMVIDPDGPREEQDTIVTRPLDRLAARLRGSHVVREVLEFRAVAA
jgi:hypothetical protein